MDHRDPRLAVDCRPDGDSWRCHVVAGDDPGRTSHDVTVSAAELERYAPGDVDPTALVQASFRFLLAREPRESILPRFRLEVIERYFPEFAAEMHRFDRS